MKVVRVGAAVVGLVLFPAHAESQYDRKLEQAAIDIVASKIGDIRGGFSFDIKPVLVPAPDAQPAGPVAMRGTYSALDPWQDGLAPAVERKTSRDVF